MIHMRRMSSCGRLLFTLTKHNDNRKHLVAKSRTKHKPFNIEHWLASPPSTPYFSFWLYAHARRLSFSTQNMAELPALTLTHTEEKQEQSMGPSPVRDFDELSAREHRDRGTLPSLLPLTARWKSNYNRYPQNKRQLRDSVMSSAAENNTYETTKRTWSDKITQRWVWAPWPLFHCKRYPH